MDVRHVAAVCRLNNWTVPPYLRSFVVALRPRLPSAIQRRIPPLGTKRKLEFAHRLWYIDVCIGTLPLGPAGPLDRRCLTLCAHPPSSPRTLPLHSVPLRETLSDNPFPCPSIRKSEIFNLVDQHSARRRTSAATEGAPPSSLILPIHPSSFLIPHFPTQHPVARRPIPLELRLAQVPNATRTSAVVINLKRRL